MTLSPRSRMLCLQLVASLSLVSGCATTDTASFPPSVDLARQAKPQLNPELITSEAYLDQHDIAIEARGDTYDGQIERLCLFFKSKGMKIDCSPK